MGGYGTVTPGAELTATTTSNTDASGIASIGLIDIMGERTVTVRASVTIGGQPYTADQSVTFGAGPLSKVKLTNRDAVQTSNWENAVSICGGTATNADLVTTAGYISVSNLPEVVMLRLEGPAMFLCRMAEQVTVLR